MKRFIIQLIAGIALLLGVLGGLHYMVLSTRARIIKLPEYVTTVFLGNSTIEYGVNDSIIPHAVNWGLNAEVVDMMYLKLKTLKQFNPQLSTAVVELDDIILFKPDIAYVTTHPYYLSQFTFSDLSNNFSTQSFDRSTDYLSHVYDIIKMRQIISSYTSASSIKQLGMGGYETLYRTLGNANSDIEITLPDDENTSIPASNIYYYHAIYNFCRDNNIKLIFIATPRHKEAWRDTRFREFHKQHFSDIPLLDYTQMAMPDSCFADIHHLNYKGANVWSATLLQSTESLIQGRFYKLR